MLNLKTKEKTKAHGFSFWKHKVKDTQSPVFINPVLKKNTNNPSNEQLFINNAEKIIQSFDCIKQQLKILESHYTDYMKNLGFEDNTRVETQIEEALTVIYSNGALVLKLLKKINPECLFIDSELSKEKFAPYQLQHEDYCSQLKSLWVELYDLKQDHKAQKYSFVKNYMQANYPNAKEQELNPVATLIVEDNCLSEGDLFAITGNLQLAELLNYVTLRYKQILKLEASINEVHQLYIDMWALTQQQGYTIDRIRENIHSAKVYVRDSVEDLAQAKRCKSHWFS